MKIIVFFLNLKLFKKIRDKRFGLNGEKIYSITKNSITFLSDDGFYRTRVYQVNILRVLDKWKDIVLGTVMSFVNPIAFVFFGTTTTANASQDVHIESADPTTNFSAEGYSNNVYHKADIGLKNRSLFTFTLPAGTDVISMIKMYCFVNNVRSGGGTQPVAHELSRSNWVESQVTWNRYSTGNNWTTAGGDYSATVIATASGIHVMDTWIYWILQGTGSTNPLSKTWGNQIDILLKNSDESVGGNDVKGGGYADADWSASDPYIEITHAPAASGPANVKSINTVVKANIKTRNGVPIASTKTINTVN